MLNEPLDDRDRRRVLIASADRSFAMQLASVLEARGYAVERSPDCEDVLARIAAMRPDVVLANVSAAGEPGRGDGCARIAAAASPYGAAVLAIGRGETPAEAAELMSSGVRDVILRPFSTEELLRRLAMALASCGVSPSFVARGRPGETKLEASPICDPASELLIGRSREIRRVIEQVRLAAPKSTTVLITGETGTGKERVAQAIHALSPGSNQEMVPVNCGGIPAHLLEDEFFGHVKGAFTDAYQSRIGRFEQAEGGTIFLDEIGDLPLELQPKLLRVLQERELHRIGGSERVEVDARVIAATNVDLWARVNDRAFREDLFYRINVFPIHLPPLRERREDIPLFIEHFLERLCRRDALPTKRLASGAEAELMARAWPGNIRELENAVEMAVIRSGEREQVGIADFPEARPTPGVATGAQPGDYKSLVARFERQLIERAMRRAGGNKTQAAEALQIKRTTLIEKIKKIEKEAISAAAQEEDLF